MALESSYERSLSFSKKIWVTVSIVALFVILVWTLKVTFNVLLLILAGVLIALYFHGFSMLLHRKLSIPKKVSLLIATIGSTLLLFLFLWFAVSRIQQQVSELRETLPSAITNFKKEIQQSEVGRSIIEKIPSDPTRKAASTIASFFSSTFGILGDLYVVLSLGIFFIASPSIMCGRTLFSI